MSSEKNVQLNFQNGFQIIFIKIFSLSITFANSKPYPERLAAAVTAECGAVLSAPVGLRYREVRRVYGPGLHELHHEGGAVLEGKEKRELIEALLNNYTKQ